MRLHLLKRPMMLVSILALILAACGGGGNDEDPAAGDDTSDDTEEQAEEPDDGADEEPADDEPADGEAADGGEGREDELRVAILTPGPTTDNGYNADAARSQAMIEEELGLEVALSESVDVANQADVYSQFASQGYGLVIGWGGQFTDGAIEVAGNFPDTDFLVVNSNAENGDNLGSLDTAIEDWQFMAGWLAGRLSETGTVGWIGADCFPATAANLHGTEQGALHANPDIEFLSTFTGDFEDPTVARQAAQAMIESDADVLTGNLNNGFAGLIEAAREADVPVITEWTDNSDTAPDTIVSSVLKSQARFVVDQVEQAQAGEFAGEFTLYELPEDWGPVLADTELLDDAIYEEALEVQEQIATGEIEPEHNEECPQG